MILVVLDFYNILLMDAGIALIVCVGLVWDIADKRGLSFPWKWLLVVFFLCFPYYPTLRINASAFATGMAILLALFELLDRDDISPGSPIKKAFLISLLSNNIPIQLAIGCGNALCPGGHLCHAVALDAGPSQVLRNHALHDPRDRL